MRQLKAKQWPRNWNTPHLTVTHLAVEGSHFSLCGNTVQDHATDAPSIEGACKTCLKSARKWHPEALGELGSEGRRAKSEESGGAVDFADEGEELAASVEALTGDSDPDLLGHVTKIFA